MDRLNADIDKKGSALKTYKTEQGSKPGTLNVTCPSRKCGFKFVVGKKWLKGYDAPEGRHYDTASCPDCFVTAWRR